MLLLVHRHWIGILAPGLALIVSGMVGCAPPPPELRQPVAAPTIASDAQLQRELDEVLDFTLQSRQLNTVEHGAWQVLHGVLAYQQEFPVRVGESGPDQSAIGYVTEGGELRGWTLQPGDILDEESGRRGLRAVVEPGTRKGQGHADQWLAVLAQAELPRDYPVTMGGQTYTMDQFIRQVQRDIPYNAEEEWSWTLIGLTKYVPTSAEWTAADGEIWSIERMVQAEIDQDIDSSACGGTHRLIGVATALNRRRAEGGAMTGVWQRAERIIQEAIVRALELQNPDGSFSAQYLRRPASSPDMSIVLGSSGHVLEFLAVAMTDEQLRNPQVQLAVQQLCGLFRDTKDLSLECGALYHAAHGLVLYRERVFGPREYRWEPQTDAT